MNLKNGEGKVQINGINHWYKIVGVENKTIPLVIVHGGPGGNHYTFERTMGPLLERYLTVIYYEQRGSGRSDAPLNDDYSIELLIDDLEQLRKSFKLDHLSLLGYSFGAELALRYAHKYSTHTNKLILQAPSSGEIRNQSFIQSFGFARQAQGELQNCIQDVLKSKGEIREQVEDIWNQVDEETVDRLLFENQEIAKRNREYWKESGLVNTGKLAEAIESRDSIFQLKLEKFHVQTLILCGLHDRNTGILVSRDLAKKIPNAELEIFHKSAHFPDLEEPEKYNEIVRNFMNA
jgi:proline iminopeptidase